MVSYCTTLLNVVSTFYRSSIINGNLYQTLCHPKTIKINNKILLNDYDIM